MNAQPKTIPSLVPPFTKESAILKIRLIEDNWNSRDPERLARGYTEDGYWRNRSEFLNGREEIIAFLKRKWTKELASCPDKDPGRRNLYCQYCPLAS
jgi:nuclear transport factor 2 (NTF2) superfamily protein